MFTDAERWIGFLGETLGLAAVLIRALAWVWRKIRKRLVEPVETITQGFAQVRGQVNTVVSDMTHVKQTVNKVETTTNDMRDDVGDLKVDMGIVKHEVEFNNGTSVKDAVRRIERKQADGQTRAVADHDKVVESVDRIEKGLYTVVQDVEKARQERMGQINNLGGKIDAVDDRLDRHIERGDDGF